MAFSFFGRPFASIAGNLFAKSAPSPVPSNNFSAAGGLAAGILPGGTAGQVLTSNGATSSPTFQAAAAGGTTVKRATYFVATPVLSTTSTSFADMASVSVNISPTGTADIYLAFEFSVRRTDAAGYFYYSYNICFDGTSEIDRMNNQYSNNSGVNDIAVVHLEKLKMSVAAGTYAVKTQWKTNTGTIMTDGQPLSLVVISYQ